MKKRAFHNLIYSVLAVALMWIAWLVAFFAAGNDLVIPSVMETFSSMGRLFLQATFWRAFGATLIRTLVSFLLALFPALALALLSDSFSWIRSLLYAIVAVLRTVPTMAVILIFLIWTTPKVAPVLVTWLVSFPMLYAEFLSALDGVGEEYREMAAAYRISRLKQVFSVYLPLSAPVALGGVGAQLSLALKVMVSAEILSKTYQSVGGMMSEAKMYFEVPELFALTILVVLLGMLLEGVCSLAKRFLVRWRVYDHD